MAVVSLDLSDSLFVLDPDSRMLFGRELIENTFLLDLLGVSVLRIRDLTDNVLFVPDTQSPSILRIRDLLETLPLLDAMQVLGILLVSPNPTQLLYRPRLLVTLSITNRDWGQSDWGAEEWGDAKLTKRYSSEDIEA